MTGRVVVVGAGAAGLTAAIRAAEAGARVTLLNAHPKPGLKILMSGGTRCNVTHREVTERDFCGGSPRAIARVLRAFRTDETLRWFEDELGVPLKLERTGKYFPTSDTAVTVLDALIAAAQRVGVTLACGARATRLAPAGGTWRIGVERITRSAELGADVRGVGTAAWRLPPTEPHAWHDAERVVLATGGLSFPRTGSDGTGYALAVALGHTLTPPVPALTPLAACDPLCRAAQGVTLTVELALWVDGRCATRVPGSLVFTHFGVSGPAALDLSRHWHASEGQARRVTINLLPGETRASLTAQWVAAATQGPARGAHSFIAARLPERIADLLIAEADVAGSAMSQTAREKRGALVTAVVERDLLVTGTLGYEKAEVTAGGVRLDEVDPATLESRVAPGVHLCGEILDVEGRLGGFNFQWAWSSGTVAGRAAGRAVAATPVA